jgi:hypothetical protein
MKKIPVCPNCHAPLEEDNLRAEFNAVVVCDVYYDEDGGLSYDNTDYRDFDDTQFYCKNCDELLPYDESEIEEILKKSRTQKKRGEQK